MLGVFFLNAKLPITNQDDVGTMFEKLSLLGKELLLKTLPKILSGELKPMPQAEEQATFSPNITQEQEAIDWTKTAQEIDNQVRGMRPWPMLSRLTKGAVGRFGQ